jgi:hypothetical protein
MLPEHILNALSDARITEGHTRPLMMLADRPQEQETLFKEIMFRRLTVREAEQIARKIALDRVRKKEYVADPEMVEIEEKLAETLGTRVHIERKEKGGKLSIDFFSNDDLRSIIDLLKSNEKHDPAEMLNKFIKNQPAPATIPLEQVPENAAPVDDRTKQEVQEDEQELYSIKNFSL